MMKKLLTLLAVGALGLGLGGPAVADPGPLDPATVEGDGHFWHIFGSSLTNTVQVEYGCTALASTRVAATWVDCELKQGGVVVDTTSSGNESVFTATVPKIVELPIDAVEVCWKAKSLRTDNTFVYDEGCRS